MPQEGEVMDAAYGHTVGAPRGNQSQLAQTPVAAVSHLEGCSRWLRRKTQGGVCPSISKAVTSILSDLFRMPDLVGYSTGAKNKPIGGIAQVLAVKRHKVAVYWRFVGVDMAASSRR